MLLAKLLEKRFPASVRTGGRKIFESADIILGGFDGQKVNISIDSDNDSELLMIRRLQNRQIYTNCACREFAASKTCQHLWAAILTIDQEQRRDLGKFVLESFGVAPPQDWRNVIHKIQKTQEAQQFQRPADPLKKKSSSTEILYVIETEKPSIRGQTGLSLSVLRGKRDASGSWGDLAKLKVTRAVVDDLAEPIDQKALKFLRGASDFFEDVATNEFELERNWDSELIDGLILSGRVLWTEELRSKTSRLRTISHGGFAVACEVGVELTEADGPGSPATFAAFVKLGAATGTDEQRLANEDIVAFSRDGIVLTLSLIHI